MRALLHRQRHPPFLSRPSLRRSPWLDASIAARQVIDQDTQTFMRRFLIGPAVSRWTSRRPVGCRAKVTHLQTPGGDMDKPNKNLLEYYSRRSSVPTAATAARHPLDAGKCDTAVARQGITCEIERRKSYGPGSNPLGMVRVLVPAELAPTAKPIADEAMARRDKVRTLLRPDSLGTVDLG